MLRLSRAIGVEQTAAASCVRSLNVSGEALSRIWNRWRVSRRCDSLLENAAFILHVPVMPSLALFSSIATGASGRLIPKMSIDYTIPRHFERAPWPGHQWVSKNDYDRLRQNPADVPSFGNVSQRESCRGQPLTIGQFFSQGQQDLAVGLHHILQQSYQL